MASIDTHYCDVDINGHINSVKYIEHVLDIWDVEWYRKHHVRRFEIAYIAEAHQGDQLKFYREKLANSDQKEYCVRITNAIPTVSRRSVDRKSFFRDFFPV